MASRVYLEGNLGQTPAVKYLVDGTAVCNFSVYCRRDVKENNEFVDKGGFWMECSLFRGKAETFVKVAKKGMTVSVTGELFEDSWQDETGLRKKMKCNAYSVALLPYQIETLTLKEKTAQGQQPHQGQNTGLGQNVATGQQAQQGQGVNQAQGLPPQTEQSSQRQPNSGQGVDMGANVKMGQNVHVGSNVHVGQQPVKPQNNVAQNNTTQIQQQAEHQSYDGFDDDSDIPDFS